jgi:hypothetical protein
VNAVVYEHVDWPQDRGHGIRFYKWIPGYLRQCNCVRIELLFEFIRVGVPDSRQRALDWCARLIGGHSAYTAALTEGQQAGCKKKQEQFDSCVSPLAILNTSIRKAIGAVDDAKTGRGACNESFTL